MTALGWRGGFLALLLLAGCGEMEAIGRPALSSGVQRLPQEAAGFQRGRTVDYERERPGYGVGVDYATSNRAAVATVSLYDRGRSSAPSSSDIDAELRLAIQEATEAAAGRSARRMAERGRSTIGGEAGLRCARLDGTFGRSPVRRLVCVGAAGSRYLRVQVTMPDTASPVADADAFAAAMLRAARG